MKLLIKKLSPDAKIPQRATAQSAGYDISSCEDIEIRPGETAKVHTGIAAELTGAPESVLLLYARSSLASKHGITLANCVGVIDTDYRGEIIVAMINQSDRSYRIMKGERIAQLVVTPVFTPQVEEADELSDTARGAGGFGSTGKD